MDLQAVLRRTIQSSIIAPSNQKVAEIQQRKHRDCFILRKAGTPRSKVHAAWSSLGAKSVQEVVNERSEDEFHKLNLEQEDLIVAGDEDLSNITILHPLQVMSLLDSLVAASILYNIAIMRRKLALARLSDFRPSNHPCCSLFP